VPCIQTRLCAVALRSPARTPDTTLAEYYARRVSNPWPMGFQSLACYEAAVASGKLLMAYAKDVDFQEKGKKPKPKPRRGKQSPKKNEVPLSLV